MKTLLLMALFLLVLSIWFFRFDFFYDGTVFHHGLERTSLFVRGKDDIKSDYNYKFGLDYKDIRPLVESWPNKKPSDELRFHYISLIEFESGSIAAVEADLPCGYAVVIDGDSVICDENLFHEIVSRLDDLIEQKGIGKSLRGKLIDIRAGVY